MNPKYESTFVFVNDYSAIKEEQTAYQPSDESGSKLTAEARSPIKTDRRRPLVIATTG